MTKIREKLAIALNDADFAKELEKFGITAESLEGIEDLQKPETLDEALKTFNFQSDFDKRFTKALQTREENLRAKYDFVEKEQKPDPVDPKNPTPDKAVLDYIKKLEKRLDDQDEAKKLESETSKKQKAIDLLKSKNIPEIYAGKFDLEKDLNEQLEGIHSDYQTDAETLIKSKLPNIKLPTGGSTQAGSKVSKEEAEEFKKQFN